MTTPEELASPHVDDYCWHPDGWECAWEGSVQAAATVTRGQAGAGFASLAGEVITHVRVWKRYVERFTVRDCWEWYATASLGEPDRPMPDGWQPQEDAPVWRFVPRDHPGAVAVWVCGMVGDEPPEKP